MLDKIYSLIELLFLELFELIWNAIKWLFSGVQDAMDYLWQWIFDIIALCFPIFNISAQPADVQAIFAQINYFFPLQEMTTMALCWATMWGSIMFYKVAKSWMPTVSGT